MEYTKKLGHILSLIQIISSIVWAIMLLVCAQVLGESFKEISIILISGFFVEFLLIQVYKKKYLDGHTK